MRINVPTNADDLIALAKAIQAKHVELGAASPLNGIEGIAQLGPLTTTSDTNNKDAKEFGRKQETAHQLRDRALGQSGPLRENTVRFFVNAARDVLLGLNKGKEQKLGDWSFEVDASPAAGSPAKPTP